MSGGQVIRNGTLNKKNHCGLDYLWRRKGHKHIFETSHIRGRDIIVVCACGYESLLMKNGIRKK